MKNGVPHDRSRTTALSDRGAFSVRTTLLACGLLSSLVYVATDIVGGLSYPGYSFFSQAISELMAVGAPSERIVDPLFIIYGVLAIFFAIGIVREAADSNRALRVTGVLLLGYAVFGMAGPTFFEMQQRGVTTGHGDVPHIILTAVLVMLLLIAIGVGAFALGKRFRNYSLGTLLVVIAFGALAAPFGAKLAAGQPTPGFGLIERVNIYASLVWVAVLGIALRRRRMAHQMIRADIESARKPVGTSTHPSPAFALRAIRLTHTIVWAFFVAVILAIPIAAWQRRFDLLLALTAIVLIEVAVLALNGFACPLAGVAARYTEDRRDNFDIYLPLFLARHNKWIFGTLFVAGVALGVVWALTD